MCEPCGIWGFGGSIKIACEVARLKYNTITPPAYYLVFPISSSHSTLLMILVSLFPSINKKIYSWELQKYPILIVFANNRPDPKATEANGIPLGQIYLLLKS